MPLATLPSRGVLRVAGPDARSFLQALLTGDMERATAEGAVFAALLTPQGKIVAEMMALAAPEADGGGFLLDVPLAVAPDLVRRLLGYKLRAAVEIADLSEGAGVSASWGDNAAAWPAEALPFADPRLPALGQRAFHARGAALPDDASETGYHAHRVALGVPELGRDHGVGASFPHEALLDRLGGVDFRKGCYVGQEIVSRMEHRGTARTRFVPLAYADGIVAEAGAAVTAGEGEAARVLGTTGSGADGRGLALLRLDRTADALGEGLAIHAGGLPVRIEAPLWLAPALPEPLRG